MRVAGADTDRSSPSNPGWLDRLAGWLARGAMAVAGTAITLMMVHVTADVIGKFVFNQPVPATYETTEIVYMVSIVFLPLAYIQRGEGHIFVELFTRRLSPRAIAWLDAAAGVLTLTWVALLSWYAGEEAVLTTRQNELRQIAEGFIYIWPSRWLVPVGCAAMTLAVAVRIAQDLRRGLRSR